VIWRLGGKFNDFAGAEILDISRQHHATLVAMEDELETYSLFNNHWQANENDRRISNAQVFTLNTTNMSVVSAQKYYNPEGTQSLAQGSAQVLSNGNVLVGWGTVPQITEFSPDGRLVWHAHLDKYDEGRDLKNMQNYRVMKYPWVGNPQYPPKLVVYSQHCSTNTSSPLTAYVSWNGATEVRYWRFWISTVSNHGPWTNAGVFQRDGFETQAILQGGFRKAASFARYARVEAIDRRGNVIGHASTETFVPSSDKVDDCDEKHCYEPQWFTYDSKWNRVEDCPMTLGAEITIRLGAIVVMLEVMVYLVGSLLV